MAPFISITQRGDESQSSESFHNYRTLAKMTKSHRMGKDDAKKRHRSEKVALHESAKSSVSASEGGSSAQKVRKTTRCGRCNCEGHTARTCSMPPLKKRKRVGLTDWDLGRCQIRDANKIKPRKPRTPLQFAKW